MRWPWHRRARLPEPTPDRSDQARELRAQVEAQRPAVAALARQVDANRDAFTEAVEEALRRAR